MLFHFKVGVVLNCALHNQANQEEAKIVLHSTYTDEFTLL